MTYYIVSAHVMVDKPTIFAAPASSVPLLAKIGGIEYLVIECLISDTGVPFIAIADNDEIPVPFEKVESVKVRLIPFLLLSHFAVDSIFLLFFNFRSFRIFLLMSN